MKKLSLTFVGAVAFAMLTAVSAWACTNLATLNLSESAVTPGQSIQVTGSSFRTAERGGQDVVFRWNTLDGEVLAQAAPDATGQVVASVTVPADAEPGYYAMIATQDAAAQDGEIAADGLSPAFGTPARASVQVGEPAVSQATPTPSAPVAASDGGSPTLVVLTGLLAVSGLALFAAGFSLFVREVRGRKVPETVRNQQ